VNGLAPSLCTGCGTELAPALLACPACQRLVHAERLRDLAAQARLCEERADAAGARDAWAQVLALLPESAGQRAVVQEAFQRWSAKAPAAARRSEAPGWLRRLGPLAAIGFGVWKLVAVAKLAPFLLLLASFGVYWRAWGWAFAAGFLASIYLHELGHVIALRRAGIPASAPMFIPGVGAFVRMQHVPPDPATNARVGLAGPVAGLVAALACYGISLATTAPLFRALAHAGAVINIFNLVPIWQLDGGRGFSSLTRGQRLAITAVAGGALALSDDRLLWLVVLAGFARSFSPRAPERPDHRAFATFALLLVAFSWLAQVAR
jgi:Zn-dependent protease